LGGPKGVSTGLDRSMATCRCAAASSHCGAVYRPICARGILAGRFCRRRPGVQKRSSGTPRHGSVRCERGLVRAPDKRALASQSQRRFGSLLSQRPTEPGTMRLLTLGCCSPGWSESVSC